MIKQKIITTHHPQEMLQPESWSILLDEIVEISTHMPSGTAIILQLSRT